MEVIKATLAATTQYARDVAARLPQREHYKPRFRGLNCSRLHETVATDTLFSSIPALTGERCAQLYVGKTSTFTQLYGMHAESQMPSTLQDFIRQWGAPDQLLSDNSLAQTQKSVHDILRMYNVKDATTEPHHPNQNPAERKIKEVKSTTNVLMDRTGTPEPLWLLCMQYVVYLLNHLAVPKLKQRTPVEVAFGNTPDISNLLQYHWFAKVYVYDNIVSFPDTKERLGHYVGPAENCGDALTHKVYMLDTEKIWKRSVLRSAETAGINKNERLNAHIQDLFEALPSVDPASARASLSVNPKDLVGYRFITEVRGDPFAARVVERLEDDKYRVELGDGEREEIMVYNELVNLVERHITEDPDDGERAWIYDEILEHRPLKGKPHQWEVLVKWATGEQSWEPLNVIHSTDIVTLAKYARENNLLHQEGWKRYKAMCRNEKRYVRMLRQAKLQKAKATTSGGSKTKYGVTMPRSKKEAIALDAKTGNKLWQEAIKKEMEMISEYETFRDFGHSHSVKPPAGYKNIRTHLVFDIKFDLRRKARLVAGGHVTDPPKESVYSGVASMRSIRMCLFLAELNGLETCTADIGNAYLEAKTNEKLYIVAGPEFGPLQGHILIFNKALYGLRTSGARWHERMADVLRDLGWTTSLADADVWMKDCGTHYEYICVYVDDLIVVGKRPMELIEELKKNFKVKGVGPPSYFLGMDFKRGNDGVLALGSETYVKKILDNFAALFGDRPEKNITTPLDPTYRRWGS
ncbi:MAG: reverse transcriptase domain-containing protein [bacterium]